MSPEQKKARNKRRNERRKTAERYRALCVETSKPSRVDVVVRKGAP